MLLTTKTKTHVDIVTFHITLYHNLSLLVKYQQLTQIHRSFSSIGIKI